MSASRENQELDTPNVSKSSHRIEATKLNATPITSPKFCSGSTCVCCNCSSAHTSSSSRYVLAGVLDHAKHVTKQSKLASERNTNDKSDIGDTESNAASDFQSLGYKSTYSTDTHEEYPAPPLYSQATATDINSAIHGVGDWVIDHTLKHPTWYLPPTSGNVTFSAPELIIGSATFITLVERGPREGSRGSGIFGVDEIAMFQELEGGLAR
ncbi:hypothetical protein IFR05_007811 [Cadophora sp. M221]|nr:hypothetical protein IFR05_007811 [Cadophora sp. M221]